MLDKLFGNLSGVFQHRDVFTDLHPFVWFVIAAVAVTLCFVKPVWARTGFFVTVVHEAGHAVAGLMVGMKLRGIAIHADMGGTTSLKGEKGNWVQQVWTTIWGYLTPGAAGSFLIWSVLNGRVGFSVTLSLVVMVLCFLQIRSMVALLYIGLSTVVVGFLWWFANPTVAAVVMFFVGWFLVGGGARSVHNLFVSHRRGFGAGSDADAMRGLTLLPSMFWIVFYGLTSLFFGLLSVLFYVHQVWSV